VRAKTLVSRSTSPDRDSHKVFSVHHTLADLQSGRSVRICTNWSCRPQLRPGKPRSGCRKFAEFESTINQERVKSRLKRARAKGTTPRRQPTGSEPEPTVRELATIGMGNRNIADPGDCGEVRQVHSCDAQIAGRPAPDGGSRPVLSNDALIE